ncbi:hypothetical protein PanWU01x14_163980 [Parasponia andersonii]|uniref:Uncharacterized protein n=1 Tax=Parasponia andersonii TaxID=3476 RepID=A0A2P5CCU9_PARAD|nr:hypothetical protein PanWU01x14_163980 [Parasponia andersonii]
MAGCCLRQYDIVRCCRLARWSGGNWRKKKTRTLRIQVDGCGGRPL